MAVTNPNTSDILFRDNLQPIQCSGYTNGVLVATNITGEEVSVLLPVDGGSCEIPLREWAAGVSFPPYTFTGREQVSVVTKRPVKTVSIIISDPAGTLPDESITLYIVPGGVGTSDSDDLRAAWNGTFLTNGPQVRKIFPGSKVFLSCLTPGTDTVIETAHYKTASGTSGIVSVNKSIGQSNTVLENVIFLTAESMLSMPGANRTLNFFDILRDNHGDMIRYYVDQTGVRFREFIFRNTLGGIDCIFATGDIKDVPEFEAETYIAGRIETELKVSAGRWHEVNTGRCDNELLRRQWMEFFESPERYVLDDDGVIRRIVVSGVNCEQELRTFASATFKYKHADKHAAWGV